MPERSDPASSNFIGLPQGELYRGGRIGKYEILTQLSVGGMAELFLAFTSGPGGFRKFVVIKRILPDARANDNFVKMFLDEGRITGALNHPNIAQVFDLGLGDEESGPYLAMEFIAGQNLNQISAACLKRRRPLPIGFSLTVTRDICLALHYAHSFVEPSGEPFPVIHRDVAQKNIMVTYEGTTKLLDFGIAKARGSLGRTNAGMVKGTTGYMSPEQVRGESLDGRSDLFSIGVMLHELLTGRRLFSAQTEAEEMERILSAPIPRPSSLVPTVPERLSDVVMQALARNRSERPPNGRALAKQLEAAAGRLLFDQEALASFMRELFEAKIAATRALLESAGAEETVMSRSAASVVTEDAGVAFPDAVGVQVPDMEKPRDTAELRVIFSQPAEGETRSLPTWLIPVVSLTVLGMLLAYVVIDRMFPMTFQATSTDPSSLPSFGAERFPGGRRPVRRPGSEDEAPDAVVQGTLTLVTTPECEVFGGNNDLGKTPLYRVAFPAGTHHIRLKGADGISHVLVVPIKPGQNTSLRVALDDVPREER